MTQNRDMTFAASKSDLDALVSDIADAIQDVDRAGVPHKALLNKATSVLRATYLTSVIVHAPATAITTLPRT